MKTVQINVRTDKEIKQKAEVIFSTLGLTSSQAVNLFYTQVILNDGLPFEIKIPKSKKPNKETLKAIHDVDNNIDVTSYNSVDDMFKDLGLKV